MAKTMANPGKSVVKGAVKRIPKPTGNQKPGKSVSSKATSSVPKLARIDRLAANVSQKAGVPNGHNVYPGLGSKKGMA